MASIISSRSDRSSDILADPESFPCRIDGKLSPSASCPSTSHDVVFSSIHIVFSFTYNDFFEFVFRATTKNGDSGVARVVQRNAPRITHVHDCIGSCYLLSDWPDETAGRDCLFGTVLALHLPFLVKKVHCSAFNGPITDVRRQCLDCR